MDTNWRPIQGSDPAAGGDSPPPDQAIGAPIWIQPQARTRIVNKISEALKRHLPVSAVSHPDGLNKLQQIAVRFEQRIYDAATSQSDYFRKISLKMLVMGTKTQQAPGNDQVIPNQNNSASADFTAQSGHAGARDWQEDIYQMIQSLKDQYFAELIELFNKISVKLHHVDSIIPRQKPSEQYDRMKSFKIMLDRILQVLQMSKSTIQPAMRDKIPQYEKQIITILNSQRKPVQPQVQQQLQPPPGK
ncbi:mediator of RNA polymerase II transcription subunit 15a isoform X2 [Triticum aestivum]|uniref:mediator of RNA polymerase II transcription subunit 15a isoform X2 n=1 Tax=Triticum aestivum TaxID=4565 RepID=UPI001D03219E|nr:mediator of RNA polymerase II transcription subunit 15a-like isoform X2 [Triticum aestivum]